MSLKQSLQKAAEKVVFTDSERQKALITLCNELQDCKIPFTIEELGPEDDQILVIFLSEPLQTMLVCDPDEVWVSRDTMVSDLNISYADMATPAYQEFLDKLAAFLLKTKIVTVPETPSNGVLTEDQVEWVLNDNGELGVKIENQFFFLYKGHSLVYESGKHDDGTPMRWRHVGSREFGECCYPRGMTEGEKKYFDGPGNFGIWKDLPGRTENKEGGC